MPNAFFEAGAARGARARQEVDIKERSLALAERKQTQAERQFTQQQAEAAVGRLVNEYAAEVIRSGADSPQVARLLRAGERLAANTFASRGLDGAAGAALYKSGVRSVVSEEAKARSEARAKLTGAATTLNKSVDEVTDAERRQLAGLDFSAATEVGKIEEDLQNGRITPEWANFLKKQIRLEGQTTGPFGSKGFRSDASNHVLGLASKVRQGITLTEDEQASYALAYNFLTAPSTSQDASGNITTITPPLPPAHLVPPPAQLSIGTRRAVQGGGGDGVDPATRGLPRLPSPSDLTGAQTRTTPGGGTITTTGPQRRSPEQAGRTAMVAQAVEAVRKVKEGLIGPDGEVNRTRIAAMTTDIPFLTKGIPGTTGSQLRSVFEDAAAAKLRLETGAQANEQELQNIVDRFMPSVLDKDATIIDKLNRMEAFFTQSLELTDKAMFDALVARGGGPEQQDVPTAPGEPNAKYVRSDDQYHYFVLPDGTAFKDPK